MATNVLKVIYTTSAKLPEIELAPGQLIFCEDTRHIQFVNSNSEVINYTSVITLATELGRTSLSHPFPALYWIKETNVLWKYDTTDGWFQLTYPPKDQIIFANRSDFPAVGDSNVLYVDGITIYRYINREYVAMIGGSGDIDWRPIV